MSKTDQTSTDNVNNNLPLVSYIILSYNQEKYIADAISSALNQSYSNIEYIISDDCSTDHTFSIIQKACNLSKKNIKILKNEVNVGLVNHLNNCLKYASGDLIVLAA